jgi:hypothetical protein
MKTIIRSAFSEPIYVAFILNIIAKHSPVSSADVKNEWSYESTSPHAHMTCAETNSLLTFHKSKSCGIIQITIMAKSLVILDFSVKQAFIQRRCQLLSLYSVDGRWMKYEYGALMEWHWQGGKHNTSATAICIFFLSSSPTTICVHLHFINPTNAPNS